MPSKGYQPKLPLKPWLRVGYNYFSGDSNNANGIHGAFFAPDPTPRNFARTPFFTESNLKDPFAQLILRPNPRLTFRGDVHGLRLADSHDLWYSGGGAYDVRNFGYTGRPSNGHSNLATLYDLSTDYQATRNLTLSLYLAMPMAAMSSKASTGEPTSPMVISRRPFTFNRAHAANLKLSPRPSLDVKCGRRGKRFYVGRSS